MSQWWTRVCFFKAAPMAAASELASQPFSTCFCESAMPSFTNLSSPSSLKATMSGFSASTLDTFGTR